MSAQLTRRAAMAGALGLTACGGGHHLSAGGAARWTEIHSGSGKTYRALTNGGSGAWRIVGVPGAPCQPEYWSQVLEGVGQDVEMFVIERPGYGPDDNEPVLDLEAQADAIVSAFGNDPNQKKLLIGQSYGAPISAYVTAGHQQMVDKLILMSGYFLPLRGNFAWLVRAAGALPAASRNTRVARAESMAHDEMMRTVEPMLARIQVKTTIIHDRSDSITPVENVDWLLARLNSEIVQDVVWASHGGHFLPADVPAEIVAAIHAAIAA